MNFFDALWRSLFSIVALFFLTKLMGKKQINQLSLYDYVVGITIGSVAAEISTNLDTDFFGGIIVMSVYSVVSIILSFLTEKSIFLRRFIIGVPIVLIQNGKILEASLKKSKFDVNELLQEARISGYYDLNQVEYAVMETNGKVSFLPKSEFLPITPKDMKLKVNKSVLFSVLVVDSKIMENNLKEVSKDEKWLLQKINEHGYTSLKDVLLVTYDNKENITIFEKNYGKEEVKILE